MEIALIQIIGSVLMVGLRVSGLVLFAPFFGSAVIPPRIKAVLVIAITAVLYPVYSPHLHAVTMAQWPGLVASETVVGIAMGAATNAVFEGALMAGQVLSVQMGYSLVNILDPLTQVDSTVIAFFHQSLAMLIFLGLDVHHWILLAVAHSFDYLPPGTATLNPMFVQALLHGGHAAGGRSAWIDGKSVAANASHASRTGGEKHDGSADPVGHDALLAALV